MLGIIAQRKGQAIHTDGFNSGQVLEVYKSSGIRLGEAQYKVYTYLLGLANNNNGACFPSQKAIAEKLGVSQARISLIVNQLQEKGLLKIDLIHLQDKFYNIYLMSGVKTIAYIVEKLVEGVSNLSQELKDFFNKISSLTERVKKKVVPKNKKNNGNDSYKPLRKEIVPSWVDTPPITKEPSSKELEEMKRLLGR